MENDERPPSPPRSDTGTSNGTPGFIPNFGMGYFSIPFERFARDDASTSAFTLLDTIETYFDSRMDLLERALKKQTDRLKTKAEIALKSAKAPSGDNIVRTRGEIERELQKIKLKVTARMVSVASAWQSTKVVRTREKISFFFGVMSLFISALLFGMAPQWIHISYTLQSMYLLPWRVYAYKKRAWHYFLFDLCYYTTVLNFIYIWIFPSSTTLWIACYCLSHGSLASAVITWRNSLVFHDWDKVTSVFIHIYAPLAFTVIRHYYDDVATRFPAVVETPVLEPVRALLISSVIYISWQALYWKFVINDRRKKIESGQRITSFSWLLNDKRGVIGRMLSSVPEQYREVSFMGGQLVYALLTEIPCFLLYRSSLWSGIFMIIIFSASVWNGGGFYIEVFGRKFERELEALRKEMAELTSSRSGGTTPSMSFSPSMDPQNTDDELPSISADSSPVIAPQDLKEPSAIIMPPPDTLGLKVVDHVMKKDQ